MLSRLTGLRNYARYVCLTLTKCLVANRHFKRCFNAVIWNLHFNFCAVVIMASSAILKKLNITSSSLLSFTESSVSPVNRDIPSISIVTNEIVLSLHQFLCAHPECTYGSLSQWLSCLYGDKWLDALFITFSHRIKMPIRCQ